MTESHSVSEQLNSDDNSGRDRLSDLPLGIIHTILSSLSTKDAVRTSILSTQWRYTWTGLPKLEFISNADQKIESEERLKEFISYALSVHKGSLHKFLLNATFKEPCPNLDEWIIRLSTKDIRELMLIRRRHLLQRVHSSIYSCNKLTCLRLDCCNVGPPPLTFNGFPFLRNLTLNRVMISSAAFESLVSNSPLLESLDWYQFGKSEKESIIRVHAPNLKCLHLRGYWTEMSMNAPLLSELWVALDTANELQRGPLCNYTNFLGGCTNLEKLFGLHWFAQSMSIGMESWNPNSLVFHRLTTISLDKVDFGDIKQQRVLAQLLVGAPNLQSLTIMSMWSSETQDAHFSGFEFESNFRMEKLRVVKMSSVRILISEIKLIEFLLERSPLLETMTVHQFDVLGTEEIKDLTDKISGCTRASLTVSISVSAIRLCCQKDKLVF